MKIPGLYVEIRGDYSQLQRDLKSAKDFVTQQATGISNALNNSINPNQVKNNINRLVEAFGTLSRASSNAGGVFSKIGVDLGDLRRVTGLSEKEFAKFQSQLLKTQAANAQENALRRIASACNLTEKEVRELGKQFGLTSQQISKINGATKQAESSLFSFSNVARSAFAYFSAYQMVEFGRSVVSAGAKIDAANRAMVAIKGSSSLAAKELDFLRQTADRTGQNFYALIDPYKQWIAASRDTALEGNKAREVFASFSEAAVVLGLSTDRVRLVFKALSDMASKGFINAEELKNQLGDNLPGALNILSSALGVTKEQLLKMMEQAEIITDVSLPKMAKRLTEMYGATAQTAALESTQAAINKLEESWEGFKLSLFDNQQAASSIRRITQAINDLTQTTADSRDGIYAFLEGIIRLAGAAASAVGNISRAIKGAAAVAAGELNFTEFLTMGPDALRQWMTDYDNGFNEIRKKLNAARDDLSTLYSGGLTNDDSAVIRLQNEITSLESSLKSARTEKAKLFSDQKAFVELEGTPKRGLTDKAREAEQKRLIALGKTYTEIYQEIGARNKEVYEGILDNYQREAKAMVANQGIAQETADKWLAAKKKELDENLDGPGSSKKGAAAGMKAERSELKQLGAELRNYADAAGEAAQAASEWLRETDRINKDIEGMVEQFNPAALTEFGRANVEQARALTEAKTALDDYSQAVSTVDSEIAKLTMAYELASEQFGKMQGNLDANSIGSSIEDENKVDSLSDKLRNLNKDLADLYEQKERLLANKGDAQNLLGNIEQTFRIENIQSAYSQIGAYTEEIYATMRSEYEKDRDYYVKLTGDKIAADQMLKLKMQEVDLAKPTLEWTRAVEIGLERVADQALDTGREIANAIERGFSEATDALAEFVVTGKMNFRNLVDSIIQDMVRLALQQNVTGPLAKGLGSFVGSLFGGGTTSTGSSGGAWDMFYNAKGNVFTSPGLSAYSNTIVATPTLFPFAKGMGLMGEAGPEAIMPLKRMRSGDLGVRMEGGGSGVVININNNASNAQATARVVEDGNDNKRIDVMIDEIVAQKLGTHGTMSTRALASKGVKTPLMRR